MVEEESFILPLYNYEIYLDKGPLYFYILILSQKIFGENKFSYIFPSQIFSLLILIIFYKLLKLFEKKEDEIWLSILILFSSIQYHFLSKAVRMDIVLSFFVIFSYYLLFLKIIKGKKGLEVIYGLSLALALLTKGPVAFIWFWAVPLIYALFDKDKRVIKFIFHPLSLFFSFLPVLIWIFLAYTQIGAQLFYEIFQKQTLGRISSSFAHKRPLFYYFYMLPLTFFPFTFFLPFSIFRKNIIKENKFLFFWFIVPFIFFSLISGKLSIYLLPLFFSISFFISKFLLSENYKIKRFVSILSMVFVLFIIIYLNYFNSSKIINFNLKNLRSLFLFIFFSFLFLFFKNKYFPFIFCNFVLIFNIFLTMVVYPITYSISLKNLSLKYNILSKRQSYGYAFWDIKPSFLYYSKKKFIELHKNEEIEEKLKEENYIIIREKNFNSFSIEQKKKIKIDYKTQRLGNYFYIISIADQKKLLH